MEAGGLLALKRALKLVIDIYDTALPSLTQNCEIVSNESNEYICPYGSAYSLLNTARVCRVHYFALSAKRSAMLRAEKGVEKE